MSEEVLETVLVPEPAVAMAATAVETPKISISAGVNKAQGGKLAVPKSLSLFNTKELSTGFFHGVIYSETSAWKTTTAANFMGPENTRIILTRRKEQLIPLRDAGFNVALVEDADALAFALQYPEQLWPEWKDLTDRTLVLDDGTEAVNMLLDDATVIDGKEVKDKRRTYGQAGGDLRELLKVTLRKPQHFVMIALAKVKENPVTNGERVGPELPPSMLSMLLTEMEFVFYINPQSRKFSTDREYFAYKTTDDNGKEKVYSREIFAKNKLPLSLGKVIQAHEELDLKKIWDRVCAAKNENAAGNTAAAAKAPVSNFKLGVKK